MKLLTGYKMRYCHCAPRHARALRRARPIAFCRFPLPILPPFARKEHPLGCHNRRVLYFQQKNFANFCSIFSIFLFSWRLCGRVAESKFDDQYLKIGRWNERKKWSERPISRSQILKKISLENGA